MQAAEPKSQQTSEQLLQMFSNLQKQMEDHQTKMIRTARQLLLKKRRQPASVTNTQTNRHAVEVIVFPLYKMKSSGFTITIA